MHILLATTGYPPEHSGAGGRLHRMYRRLSESDPAMSWSVVTKRRDRSASFPAGPRRISACIDGRDDERSARRHAIAELAWTARELRAGLLDGVDLLHAAGWSWMTPLIVRAARRRGIPVVRELTTAGEAGRDSLGGRLIRWTNRRADAIVAISPALAEAARKTVGTDKQIWCRPNGVDLDRFRPGDADARALARAHLRQWLPRLADGAIVVLHVGRIRPLKNQLFLADCIARLPPPFHLVLVGPTFRADGAYVTELRRRMQEPDLAARAVLVEGHADDVERFMQGADLFAFPSESEGLGTVMLEALCCGLPVVASWLPGVTDWIVRDGVNGWLADLDPSRFAERIADAARLTVDRRHIAEAAAMSYGQEAVDRGYRELFARALARG